MTLITAKITAKAMASSTGFGSASRDHAVDGGAGCRAACSCSTSSSLVCIAAASSLDAGGNLVDAATQLFELRGGLLRLIAREAAQLCGERRDALAQGVGL